MNAALRSLIAQLEALAKAPRDQWETRGRAIYGAPRISSIEAGQKAAVMAVAAKSFALAATSTDLQDDADARAMASGFANILRRTVARPYYLERD